MTNKQTLKLNDIELFRQSMGEVVPIIQNTVELEKHSVKKFSTPVFIHSDYNDTAIYNEEFIPESLRVSAVDQIQFKRTGLQDKVYRKLRRGQIPIVACLDLHGMTAYKARIALQNFLTRMHLVKGQSCVRIIHGKGYGSQHEQPVIKQNVQIWLQESRNVLAYCSCRPSDGGTGAIYLLLKGGHK